MNFKRYFRQIILPIILSFVFATAIIKMWPNNGTLDRFATNYIARHLGLDGETAYDVAMLEAWFEISLFMLIIFYSIRKINLIRQDQPK